MIQDPNQPLAHVLDQLRRDRRSGDSERVRFARAVDRGLRATPRTLDSQYLYDTRGSELFEAICEQPEYYPTRSEEQILALQSGAISELTGPLTVVELGAGTSRKTVHLLRAYDQRDALRGYLAVDVSASALEKGKRSIQAVLPSADLFSLCGSYEAVFPALARLDRTLVSFLGSTIGNFPTDAMTGFFRTIAEHLKPGDFFLLGVDLHKETRVLEAAYNDAAGVTAAFTRNLFARMNRELSAGLDLEGIQHRAHYNASARQIEIFAEFTRPQALHVGPLGVSHPIAAGERIQTEVSRKFVPADLVADHLEPVGFMARETFHDERGYFGLLLLERVSDA